MTLDLRDQSRELCAVIDEEQGPITLDDIRARNDAVIPIDRPTRRMVPVRRRWLVAVVTAALVVAASLPLFVFSGPNEPDVATTPPTGPPTTRRSSAERVPSGC